MKRFWAGIDIAAKPDRIWQLLTDAPAYPAWNPTVTGIDGQIALGERITVHARINPGRTFPVRVTEITPTRMVWRGAMPLGLFIGERVFTLSEGSSGHARLEMVEQYRGPLASLITRSIPDLQPEFAAFLAAVKAAAETE